MISTKNTEARDKLFEPLTLGAVQLKHRIVMAPLTRMRASRPGNVPNALNALYYTQRATEGGLIIAEASQVAPEGQGMPATPGIHTDTTRRMEAGNGWCACQRWPYFFTAMACGTNFSLVSSAGWFGTSGSLGHRGRR